MMERAESGEVLLPTCVDQVLGDVLFQDDLRHRAGRSVAKMTAHGVAGHFPEFFEGIALGGDGMTEGGGDRKSVV